MNVSLEGSIETIIEFFEFAIYCILYQRQIYSQECFTFKKKYNTTLVAAEDPEITTYVQKILGQAKNWMKESDISTLVLVIVNMDNQVKERWQFDIQYQSAPMQDAQKQISAIIKQITCSVGFLPVFEDKMTFNVLAYTNKNAKVPIGWLDSDAKLIHNPELVKLRELDTGMHKVGGMVQYKIE
jgi:mitotic spindle assembly checkpoint protein MAD2